MPEIFEKEISNEEISDEITEEETIDKEITEEKTTDKEITEEETTEEEISNREITEETSEEEITYGETDKETTEEITEETTKEEIIDEGITEEIWSSWKPYTTILQNISESDKYEIDNSILKSNNCINQCRIIYYPNNLPGYLPIYSNRSYGSTVIGNAYYGDVFDIIDETDIWITIKFGRQIGYISKTWNNNPVLQKISNIKEKDLDIL